VLAFQPVFRFDDLVAGLTKHDPDLLAYGGRVIDDEYLLGHSRFHRFLPNEAVTSRAAAERHSALSGF
jgi:hypothetical protein